MATAHGGYQIINRLEKKAICRHNTGACATVGLGSPQVSYFETLRCYSKEASILLVFFLVLSSHIQNRSFVSFSGCLFH